MNVLSLFDGISCGRVALERAGIPVHRYSASEIDKYAIKVSRLNWIGIDHVGDVHGVRVAGLSFVPDLILGGSPCQDLSNLKNDGQGLGGEKSKLFFEYVRILKEAREINPNVKFILENVVPRKVEWADQISHHVGVSGVKINSDLWVPQNRPRMYWTNIKIPPLPDRPNWDGKYYQWRRTYFRENMSGVCPCLTANMGTGGHNVPLKSKDLKDKLTPEECEELQGLKMGYTAGVSNSQRYKIIGNGWTIEPITHILSPLKEKK